ncbi:hypothetical protein BT69DRAFT_896939 [Atractiella rhizophila]|nr:hypothetical protein BT69DRAFT_896939 [Atractiella rhizophila]
MSSLTGTRKVMDKAGGKKKRVCGPCRKRKSRCDCLLPCSTCVSRGKAAEDQCYYPEDPYDLEKRRREVVTLRSELDRLERIIVKMKRSKEEQRRYSMSAAGPSSFMNGTGWVRSQLILRTFAHETSSMITRKQMKAMGHLSKTW